MKLDRMAMYGNYELVGIQIDNQANESKGKMILIKSIKLAWKIPFQFKLFELIKVKEYVQSQDLQIIGESFNEIMVIIKRLFYFKLP